MIYQVELDEDLTSKENIDNFEMSLLDQEPQAGDILFFVGIDVADQQIYLDLAQRIGAPEAAIVHFEEDDSTTLTLFFMGWCSHAVLLAEIDKIAEQNEQCNPDVSQLNEPRRLH